MPAKTWISKTGLGICLKPYCTCRKICVPDMFCFPQFYQLGQQMVPLLPVNFCFPKSSLPNLPEQELGDRAGENTMVFMNLVTAQSSRAHHELHKYFWRLYKTTDLRGNMDFFRAQRESSTVLISVQFQRSNLLLKVLWVKLQWFPQDFAGFVHFNVLLQLLAFSLCSLRHLVLLQGLGKRKIAACIFKQTIKIKSTMYWHRRIHGVIHMFLGSVRLLLCTANSTSPVFSSLPCLSVIHFSFSKKHRFGPEPAKQNCLF